MGRSLLLLQGSGSSDEPLLILKDDPKPLEPFQIPREENKPLLCGLYGPHLHGRDTWGCVDTDVPCSSG